MRITSQAVYAVFAAMLLLASLSSCSKPQEQHVNSSFRYASFRDVPGITDDEIAAVEALQRKYDSFVYGMIVTTEAFYDDGEVRGYSALICEWMSEFFGIPFRHAIFA